MKCAVKYCGGCNPHYDRTAFVERLEERLGIQLYSAQHDFEYDEVYVVCGCMAHCADTSNIKAKKFILIDSEKKEKYSLELDGII